MITELNIIPVKPSAGLVGFASMVIYQSFYVSSVAIYKRLDGTGYRLVYPTKKIGEKSLNIFHPIDSRLARQIEHAVTERCIEIFEAD